MAQDYTPKPSDRFIPWYFVGVFAVLMALMGVFIWIAFSTYTGEVTDDPYRLGQHYNDTLAASDAQEKLGWQATLEMVPSKANPLEVNMRYRLQDKAGAPITDAHVTAIWVRPIQAGHDQNVTLTGDGKGVYTLTLTLPLHGLWRVDSHATRGKDEFRESQTVVLP